MQLEKFGTVALPLYVVMDANDNTLTTFAGMTRDEAIVVQSRFSLHRIIGLKGQ